MITVHPFGAYSHRHPLAYGPIQEACAPHLRLTDQPEAADILLVTHTKDLLSEGADLAERLGAGQRLVLLSEEPFWDSVWGADPFTRDAWHPTSFGAVPVTCLTHTTSDIFDFARIPYLLLTERTYWNRYSQLFAEAARKRPRDWQADWAQRPRQAVFMSEKRRNRKFDVVRRSPCGTRSLRGLSAFRTRLALACQGHPDVQCLGHGWQKGPAKRQDLPDWHLDKLTRLQGQTRLMSALENTQWRSYLTEKMFDAFAIGAVPFYLAEPDHRIHDMLPPGAWINLEGASEAQAAEQLLSEDVTDRAKAYVEAQTALADLFGDPSLLMAERTRLAQALTAALGAVLDAPDPRGTPA